MTDQDDRPLLALLDHLRDMGYVFVCPTPETQRRVVARKQIAEDLRDIFGWSRPFAKRMLPDRLFGDLRAGGWLEENPQGWSSRVRVSSLDEQLFVHSRYPTDDREAVFFGPDSYRFARFLFQRLADAGPVRTLVDLGAGTGVGAITAARRLPGTSLVTVDINPLAVRFTRVNAAHAGVRLDAREADGLEGAGDIDLVVANPPYLTEPASRTYRHGGRAHGSELSLRWVEIARHALAPGGRLLLYTGSAIVDGRDDLRQAVQTMIGSARLHYEELDPDVFGEELDAPAYHDVERIAVVGIDIRMD